jgi:hypothetical protein
MTKSKPKASKKPITRKAVKHRVTKPVIFIHPNPGKTANDIEVLLGKIWVAVSSVKATEYGSIYWKSQDFEGNCPASFWRLK